jgi:hypothetical protein
VRCIVSLALCPYRTSALVHSLTLHQSVQTMTNSSKDVQSPGVEEELSAFPTELHVSRLDHAREALRLRPEGHPERAMSCEDLAESLWICFSQTGDMTLLDKALELEREALRLRPEGHPDRALSCGNLANLLRIRFNQTGDMALLDKTLELEREALRLRPEGHSDRALSCGNLAESLRIGFNQTGDTVLLNEALELEREALRLRPEGHPHHALSCGNLAALLITRFNQSGDMALLDEAFELEREALRLRPEGHPHRAMSCGNLAESLRIGFNQTGDMVLLNEALELEREALRLRPEGHPDRAMSCGNLANLLRIRFSQTRDMALLDKTLELEREALRLRPEGHPDRALSCGNLAISLRIGFHRTGDTVLLDEALECDREALRLRPEGHPDRAMSCGNLAISLRTCFDQTGDTLLLDEARSVSTQAIKQSAVSPSDHVHLRAQLAHIHAVRSSSLYDPSAAVGVLLEAIQYRAGMVQHFYAVNSALSLCVKAVVSNHDHVQLLAVYQAMIELLPELGSAVLDKASRLRRWRDAGNLPLQALLCALKANDLPLGLELMEQGRAVLWSQTLAMQDSQFHGLTDGWKLQLRALFRSMSCAPETSNSQSSELSARDEAHASYTRLQQVLKQIRAFPGMERFMRGPSYAELVQVASAHPVVIITPEDKACHAIIISATSTIPKHLILDSITVSDLDILGHDVRGLDLNVRAMSPLASGVSMEVRALGVSGRPKDPTVRKLHQSLKRLWLGIVKPILDCLGLKVRAQIYTSQMF